MTADRCLPTRLIQLDPSATRHDLAWAWALPLCQLTEQLLVLGDRVLGTVRRPEAVSHLVERYPDAFASRSST